MDERKILSSLSLITQAINSSIRLEQVLKLISLEAVGLLDADICSVLLLDDTRQELVFCEAFGLTKDEREKISFHVGEGLAGWVAKTGRPVVVDDVEKDPRYVAKLGQTSRVRSLLAVPLSVKGQVIGVMNFTNKDRTGAFSEQDKDLAILLANHVATNIERFRLYELSITDSLTGAYNYRYFHHQMDKEIGRSQRYGGAVSLAMLDLDHFKKVNDQYGHTAGDDALRTLVELLRESTRNIDVICRYGGEEFAIVLPNTDRAGALDIAGRLCEKIRLRTFAVDRGELRLTASLGVSTQRAGELKKEDLIRRADEALYAAKQGGRDQVVFKE